MIVEHTTDGSNTLYVPELDEHYHSVKGAWTESQHIFVDMGMKHSETNPIHILEIGFGTGLNAFLTLLESQKGGKKVEYTTIELFPLKWDIIEKLNYTTDSLFKEIHTCAWEERREITPGFSLFKKEMDFTKLKDDTTMKGFDVVYFDAFAPEKQPEMWNKELFKWMYETLNPNGILTTYCSKGAIRRMLEEVGFTSERLPGPPGGKREILRVIKK